MGVFMREEWETGARGQKDTEGLPGEEGGRDWVSAAGIEECQGWLAATRS